MSQATRSLTYVLAAFRREALHSGLTRKEMAHELWSLRQQGADFARSELIREYT